VTATLDGKDRQVYREENPRRGCLQFNGAGRAIRFLPIEFRDSKQPFLPESIPVDGLLV